MSLARDLTHYFGGDWNGRFGLVPGPGHSKGDRSLKIAPHANDLDDVVLHSFAGDEALAIKKVWREQGLLPRRSNAPERSMPEKARRKPDADDEKKRLEIALYLWSKARSGAKTFVQKYMEWRGINIDPFPPTIRYLPASERHPYPAMIVAAGVPDEPEVGIYRLPDRVTGVHLTYLAENGLGKAPVNPPRRMLGTIKSYPLALIPPNDGLGLFIGEGVETALAVHAQTGLGAWAAGAAGFLPSLADAVPDFIETITVFVEDDPAGERGALELMERLHNRGFEVLEWRAR